MATHIRRGPPKITIWPNDTLTNETQIGHMVESFSVSKQLGQPAGTFTISLLPYPASGRHPTSARAVPELASRILPNTVVSIGFEEDGGIMVGLVDRVERRLVLGGPSASYRLTITGRDFGKVLVNDHVILASLTVPDFAEFTTKITAALGANHPLLQFLPGVFGPTTRDGVPTFLNTTVEEVAQWLLANVGSLRIPLLAEALGGDGLPGDYMSVVATTWNDGRIWKDSIHQSMGTIWSYLQQILDPDFYEIWIDSIPNVDGLFGSGGAALPNVVLNIRPKPFDEDKLAFADVSDQSNSGKWADLKTQIDQESNWEIALDEVLNFSTAIDDSGALSYYQVTSMHELIGNPDALSEGLAYPLVDTFNAARFGLRSYQSRLSLVAGDVAAKSGGSTDYAGEVAEDVRRFRNRLFNWYRLAPWFERGSITVVGRDRYRPGDPVNLDWHTPAVGLWSSLVSPGVRFYCTGVQWGWSLGGGYTSTLTLDRGHNDSLLDFVATWHILATAPVTNLDHFVEV